MKGNFTQKLKDFSIHYSIVCAIFIAVIIFCFIDPTLVSIRNVRNIFSDLAPLLLASIGVAMCFFAGHIDITASAVAGFAGLVAGSFVQRADLTDKFFNFGTAPAFLIIPATVVIFSLFGLVYALVICKTKIHARIFTLGSIVLIFGISHLYASSYNFDTLEIAGFSDQFLAFGTGYIGKSPALSIPFTVITTIVVTILAVVYLKVLKLDLNSVGVEDNSKKLKDYMLLYMPATALFALAGIMIAARNNVATPHSAISLSTETITICLIAGFSIKGNRGSISSVIITTILYVALMYSITFIGLNYYITEVVQGALFLGALFLDHFISTKKATSIKEVAIQESTEHILSEEDN